MLPFNSLLFNAITIIIILFAVLCFYVSRKFSFWKNQGVPYIQPLPFFGSLKDVILQRLGIGFFLNNIYNFHKGIPYVGIFSYDEPAVVIRDLDLVRNVLVKDSEVFIDHICTMDEKLDPLGSRILFTMKGHDWKLMRAKLSPTFTSGKMKTMYTLVDDCAKELIHYLDRETTKDSTINVKDTISKFTIDVISTCAFGIDSNSLKNPDAEFPTQLNKVFTFSAARSFSVLVSFFAPKLYQIFRVSFFDPSINGFVRETLWSTADYREKNGIVRKDFLDSIIELRKKGLQTPTYNMQDDDLAAQAFSFLAAGFETSSSTISFTLYELSLHPELQKTLREEIKEVLKENNNEVTYDAIQKMTYLDMAVSETLRKYPILPFLDRKCLSDYKLPAPSGKGTVTIPAGTGIYIPLMAMQYDPEYFPEPEKYDPERFSEENKQKRPNYCYMPFGEGPRFCIGMRFGLMQTKTGLVHILTNYEVEPCKDTQVPLKFDNKSFLLSPEKGISLSFKKLTKT